MNAKSIAALTLYLAAFAAAYREGTSGSESTETGLARAMDELNAKDDIEIYGGMISLAKVPVEEETRTARSSDPLVSRIEDFLRTRKIQVRLPTDGSSADLFGRALGQKDFGVELRGLTEGASEPRTKLKKIIMPLLLALTVKKMIVLPLIITLVALIGFKGLGAGLMSLLLSGAVALKSLLTPPPPPPRISYGIVKSPEVHHDHWHRSQEEVNQPFRGWAPEYPAEQYPYPDVPV